MRLLDLDLHERRRAPTKIMYHGTSSDNFKSIMSNGLVVNPSKKVWDTDDNGSSFTRASVGGVYLAGNYMTALSSASNARRKLGGDHDLIIICQVQPRAALPDEDDFRYIWDDSFNRVLRNSEYQAAVVLGMSAAGRDLSESFDLVFDSFRENLFRLKEIEVHPNVEGRLKKVLSQGLMIQCRFLASRLSPLDYKSNFIRGAGDSFDWDSVPELEVEGIEAEMIQFMDQITRVLKSFAWQGRESFQDTLRVTETIGFSGRTKIIG